MWILAKKPKHICKHLFCFHITFVGFLLIIMCHPSAAVHSAFRGGPTAVNWRRMKHCLVRVEYSCSPHPTPDLKILNPPFGVFTMEPPRPQEPCIAKSPSVYTCLITVRGSLHHSCNWLVVSLTKTSFVVSGWSLLNVGNSHHRHCQAGHGSACTVTTGWKDLWRPPGPAYSRVILQLLLKTLPLK